ncbi:hypothetical protein [Phyllobacterium phragmitis]|nr:hypothetical protein [Phyllobacterium phragmitis]
MMTKAARESRIEYIRDMLRELHKISESDRFGILPYFISMAIIEADHTYRFELIKKDVNGPTGVGYRADFHAPY